jgi:hypothetical protein
MRRRRGDRQAACRIQRPVEDRKDYSEQIVGAPREREDRRVERGIAEGGCAPREWAR